MLPDYDSPGPVTHMSLVEVFANGVKLYRLRVLICENFDHLISLFLMA